VVEIRFDTNIPKIYDAVITSATNSDNEKVVIEVLQQLEDGYVRGIAMTSTDGLKRGDEVVNT